MSRSQIKNNSSSNSKSKQANEPLLIKGRVYSVIMDETHPFFDKTLGKFDSNYIGYVFWGDVGLKEGSLEDGELLKLPMAKSYFNWFTYPPLITEIVDIIKIPSSNHYLDLGGRHNNVEYAFFPPINIWNNSVGNILPREADIVKAGGNIPIGKTLDETKVFSNKNMLPFEGDMIFEGRFGNSIRFGSSNPRGKNNWSENSSEGEPITIISNGQTKGHSMALEDINGDASSIYLTSNQNIDNLNIASKNFKSLNAIFSPPQSDLEVLQSFTNNSTSVTEALNNVLSSSDGDSNFSSQPNEIVEGASNPNTTDHLGDDQSAQTSDEIEAFEAGGGFDQLVKIPGKYVDNAKVLRELYIIPKRFTSGTGLVTDILAPFLMKMLEAAEKEGVRLIVNSGFRPPLDTIYLNNKELQKSQKTVRLGNLLNKYKGAFAEPWLEYTTVIKAGKYGEKNKHYNVGDSYKMRSQGEHFSPLTAASFYSPHGASMAVDFSTDSATNKQFKWLCKNGWKYGFIRTVYSEPWHFGYRPADAKKGPTAKLEYKYQPGVPYTETKNRWNNVFGSSEPNWDVEYTAFIDNQAQTV